MYLRYAGMQVSRALSCGQGVLGALPWQGQVVRNDGIVSLRTRCAASTLQKGRVRCNSWCVTAQRHHCQHSGGVGVKASDVGCSPLVAEQPPDRGEKPPPSWLGVLLQVVLGAPKRPASLLHAHNHTSNSEQQCQAPGLR